MPRTLFGAATAFLAPHVAGGAIPGGVHARYARADRQAGPFVLLVDDSVIESAITTGTRVDTHQVEVQFLAGTDVAALDLFYLFLPYTPAGEPPAMLKDPASWAMDDSGALAVLLHAAEGPAETADFAPKGSARLYAVTAQLRIPVGRPAR